MANIRTVSPLPTMAVQEAVQIADAQVASHDGTSLPKPPKLLKMETPDGEGAVAVHIQPGGYLNQPGMDTEDADEKSSTSIEGDMSPQGYVTAILICLVLCCLVLLTVILPSINITVRQIDIIANAIFLQHFQVLMHGFSIKTYLGSPMCASYFILALFSFATGSANVWYVVKGGVLGRLSCGNRKGGTDPLTGTKPNNCLHTIVPSRQIQARNGFARNTLKNLYISREPTSAFGTLRECTIKVIHISHSTSIRKKDHRMMTEKLLRAPLSRECQCI